MNFKKLAFLLPFLLSSDDIISQRPGMKTFVKFYIFWSEIGSGFGEPSGTPPPRISRCIPPPGITFTQTLNSTNDHTAIIILIILKTLLFTRRMKNGKHHKCWLHEEYHLVIPAVLQKKKREQD